MGEQAQLIAIFVELVHEHAVRRERSRRLLGDDLRHLCGRRRRAHALGHLLQQPSAVGGELRVDPGGLLELVQLGPLERLTARSGRDVGQSDHVVVDDVGMREREPHRSHDATGGANRHGQRRGGVRDELGSFGEHSPELAGSVGVRRLAGARGCGDRRARGERQAQARVATRRVLSRRGPRSRSRRARSARASRRSHRAGPACESRANARPRTESQRPTTTSPAPADPSRSPTRAPPRSPARPPCGAGAAGSSRSRRARAPRRG